MSRGAFEVGDSDHCFHGVSELLREGEVCVETVELFFRGDISCSISREYWRFPEFDFKRVELVIARVGVVVTLGGTGANGRACTRVSFRRHDFDKIRDTVF
jgi:hypothetical protein